MCNNTLSLHQDNNQTTASTTMQPATQITIRAKGGDKIDKYPAKAHAKRVAEKLKLNNGMILISGATTEYYPDSDQPIPFRQDRAFYYLSGVSEPGCHLTYETANDKLTLWLPKADEGRRVFYDGRNLGPKEAMEKYDFDEVKVVRGPGPRKTNLRKALVDHHEAGGEFAYFKLPGHLMGKPLKMKLKERRKMGLRPAIKQCRLIKDEHEIQLIRNANEVSAKAHRQVMNRLHALKSEPQALAVYMRTCLANNAQEQAYTPIIGSGHNAAQLHYTNNDQHFGKAQTLLIDAGAEWEHYASDVTRTMPINQKKPGHWASKEAETVYKAVEKIQEECIKQLKPGAKFIDVSWLAVHMAIDALLDMGILKGDHMEIFHAGTVLGFFPHGLGHHLGLDVHDGMGPPKDDGKHKKGKDGKGKDGKDKDGEEKVGPKKLGMKKNGGGKKNNDNWTVVKDEVLFDAENETDLTETENESDALLEKDAAATINGSGNGKGKGNGNGNGKKPAKDNINKPNADPRFKALRAAYNAYATTFNNHTSTLTTAFQNPTSYSLNPAHCHGPNTPSAPALKAGMVITIEPGLYFNRHILKTQFLSKEKHSKFIDEEVLGKYFPVGGVRIEDDVLITKEGHENLTTAVKGEEMLKVIRKGGKEGKGKEE